MKENLVKKCARLLVLGRKIEEDVISLMVPFPFSRWGFLYHLGRALDWKGDGKITELNLYFRNFRRLRNVVSVRSTKGREVMIAYLGRHWTMLGDRLALGIAESSDLKSLCKEIDSALKDAEIRRALIALMRATTELSWMSALFVFRAKEARLVLEAKDSIRSGDYERSYDLSLKVLKRMKWITLKSVVEKAFVYAAATALAFFVQETTTAYFIGLLFLLIMVAILPYYTFTKLFYDSVVPTH